MENVPVTDCSEIKIMYDIVTVVQVASFIFALSQILQFICFHFF